MHTLNEQSYSFTATTAEESVEKIKEFLSGTFGWFVDGDYIYLGQDKKIGLSFATSGTSVQIGAVNQFAKTSAKTASALSMTIFYHTSADENTIYVSFGASNGFVFAKTTDDTFYAFVSNTTNQIQFLSEYSTEVGNTTMPGKISEIFFYSIQKMPAVFSGGTFESLFNVFSAPLGQLRNQLVSFSGDIYRIVYISGVVTYPFFAFKVSDGEV